MRNEKIDWKREFEVFKEDIIYIKEAIFYTFKKMIEKLNKQTQY